ncbi:MAG: response regulator transcription factor [Phycisphaerales bacterium]|nr:MAG: response regulator transcription factor [Phycisphaerales bacterium]
MNPPISILVVDDHAIVRSSLARTLNDEQDMTVVGTAGDADEALAEAIRLKPAVILMDIDMPGLLCFSAVETIHARCPGTRVIFLSAFAHDRFIEQALAVEASGYITKDEPTQTVVDAIRNAVGGIAYFSPAVRSRIVVDSSGAHLAQRRQTRADTLTPRELEVLRYLARGMSKKEVAATMHLSVKTVEYHSASLMNKLDIHDRVELARFAIREGLAEP